MLKSSTLDGRLHGSQVFEEFWSGKTEPIVILLDKVRNPGSPVGKMRDARLLYDSDSAVFIDVFTQWSCEDCLLFRLLKCRNITDFSNKETFGFLSVFFLSERPSMCTKLSLFGFLGASHEQQPYHYFANGVDDSHIVLTQKHYADRDNRGLHNFAEEQNCLLKSADFVDVEQDIMTFNL